MPAVSSRQRRFFGAELARKRAGKKTRTGLSAKKLKEFAKGPVKKRSAPVQENILVSVPMTTRTIRFGTIAR